MLTFIIIAITAFISYKAFNNSALVNKLIFYPPEVNRGGWYRLFSYGVLHADYTHLIFNMITFFIFGQYIEKFFKGSLGEMQGSVWFITLYVSALLVSILPTYFKHKNNQYYRGLGASGAVSAVVFAYILINPMSFMGIMFIPIMLPAFLFGIIYVVLSIYLEKKQAGNVNHSAHITGGIYGILFVIILFYVTLNADLITHFFSQIKIDSISDLFHFGF
ncbi:MAG: rhomboid family intramembrane serine protease [Porphyromonadaceae bacterium]|jgi:membrane associated rhomboid family serine protease|nr:rhomboid family intramembrane serine protease [Porphyromonadaceae bacterium]